MDITGKLIFLVHPPFLYDCRQKENKNDIKPDPAWIQLSKKINTSRTIIKKKWKTLKDGYSKYKKVNKNAAGQKKPCEKWFWCSYLNFLDGAIQMKSTTFKVVPTSKTVNNADDGIQNTKKKMTNPLSAHLFKTIPLNNQPKEECHLTSIEKLLEATLATTPKIFRQKPLKNHSDVLIDRVLSYIENKKKNDSIDTLFASYAKSFKNMKPATQAHLKVKLAKVFANAELKDLQVESQGQGSVFSVSSDTDTSVLEEIDKRYPLNNLWK